MGLDGVEVFNNRQTKEYEKIYLDFAKENNMEWSGGSDFHKKFGVIERKRLGHAIDHNISIDCYSAKLRQLIFKTIEK